MQKPLKDLECFAKIVDYNDINFNAQHSLFK